MGYTKFKVVQTKLKLCKSAQFQLYVTFNCLTNFQITGLIVMLMYLSGFFKDGVY